VNHTSECTILSRVSDESKIPTSTLFLTLSRVVLTDYEY
jgi:hypothetical protein